MYKRPKGFRSVITQLISAILLLMGVLISLLFALGTIMGDRPFLEILSYSFGPLIIAGLPGLVLASRFPDIRISNKGVHFRYLKIIIGLILWEEIDSIIKLEHPKSLKDYYAIVIDRVGYIFPFIFKGLYIQSLHAILLRIYEPVLLISPGTLDEDEIKMIKEAAISKGL